MDKFETRRQALIRLRESLGRGAIARIAAEIGKEPNYVSRMMYPVGKSGGKRIGEDSVEILDRKFPGWQDRLAMRNEAVRQAPAIDNESRKTGSSTFSLLDVRAACGDGAINDDYPEIVSSLTMPVGVAQSLIGTTNRAGSIKIIVAAKDSMMPTINPDDLLFVDISVSEYVGETIYILFHGNELVCKRLSLVGKNLTVISDNKAYPQWLWSDRPDTTRIVGKVVRALPIAFKKFAMD